MLRDASVAEGKGTILGDNMDQDNARYTTDRWMEVIATDEKTATLQSKRRMIGYWEGTITRGINALEASITSYKRDPMERTLKYADEQMAKVMNWCNKWEALLLLCGQEDDDEENQKAYDERLDNLEQKKGDLSVKWAKTQKDFPLPGTVRAQQVQAQAPAPHPQEGSFKEMSTLKPDELDSSFKPAEVKRWQGRLALYYEISRMNTLPRQNQAKYVRTLMSKEIVHKLEDYVNDDMDIFPPEGEEADMNCWMGALDRVFRDMYPIVDRRYTAFNMTQQPGETFKEFAKRARDGRDEADVWTLTPDDWLACVFIHGTSDEELRREFRRRKDQTVAEMEEMGMIYESTRKYGKSNATAAAAQGRQDNRKSEKIYDRKSTSGAIGSKVKRALEMRPDLQGKCLYCGSNAHQGRDCSSRGSQKCNICGKGHVTTMCLKKELDKVNAQDGAVRSATGKEYHQMHEGTPPKGPAPLSPVSFAAAARANVARARAQEDNVDDATLGAIRRVALSKDTPSIPL